MISENLQLGRERPDSPSAQRPAHARSTSSEYPCNSHGSPRVISPASTMRVDRLSLSDLSRFGRGNDRLSYLGSGSTASSTRQAQGDANHHEAIHEATAAISGWQDEPRPTKRPAYNQYELADSSEVLPGDSLSQRLSPPPLEFEPLASAISGCASPSDGSATTWESLQRLKGQYDGPADPQRPKGPGSASSPPPRPNKRSASQFSLRSLTRSFSKRPRLRGIRKLASHVYRGGGRRLTLACHKWRLQKEQERRQFEAWKANRRRERPADPLKGKSEPGFGTFSLERGRYGNEEWWQEGVAKYQAPSWMLFQK